MRDVADVGGDEPIGQAIHLRKYEPIGQALDDWSASWQDLPNWYWLISSIPLRYISGPTIIRDQLISTRLIIFQGAEAPHQTTASCSPLVMSHAITVPFSSPLKTACGCSTCCPTMPLDTWSTWIRSPPVSDSEVGANNSDSYGLW